MFNPGVCVYQDERRHQEQQRIQYEVEMKVKGEVMAANGSATEELRMRGSRLAEALMMDRKASGRPDSAATSGLDSSDTDGTVYCS